MIVINNEKDLLRAIENNKNPLLVNKSFRINKNMKIINKDFFHLKNCSITFDGSLEISDCSFWMLDENEICYYYKKSFKINPKNQELANKIKRNKKLALLNISSDDKGIVELSKEKLRRSNGTDR